MADAFIGEIRLLPYTFAPSGWMRCMGQSMLIAQYQVLFAVIGYQFGRPDQNHFNLPNLNGRTAVGTGNDPADLFDPVFASHGGSATVPLSPSNTPPHDHTLNGVQLGQAQRSATPAGNLLTGVAFRPDTGSGPAPTAFPYDAPPQTTNPVGLNPGTLSPFVGGSTPHENRQPLLALQWCICVADGEFPMRPS